MAQSPFDNLPPPSSSGTSLLGVFMPEERPQKTNGGGRIIDFVDGSKFH